MTDINDIIKNIDELSIPLKVHGDKLTSSEFNNVVDKINEISRYISDPINNTLLTTYSTIYDRLNNIESALDMNSSDDRYNVSYLNERIDDISKRLNISLDNMSKIELSYDNLVTYINETTLTFEYIE